MDETWIIGLWIDNDEGSQSYWRECATEIRDGLGQSGGNPFLKGTSVTIDDQVRHKLAEVMKDEIEEACERGIEGLAADMMGAALSEVDWDEIAASILAELPEADE